MRPAFIVLMLDTLVIFAVFNLTAWIRGLTNSNEIIVSALVPPWLLIVTALYLIDGYRSRTEMMSADYTSQHIVSVLFAMIGVLLVTFVVIPGDYPLQASRGVIAISFVLISILTLSYRRSMHRWGEANRRELSVLFIGSQSAGAEFKEVCEANRLNQRIIFAITDDGTSVPFPSVSSVSSSTSEAIISEISNGEFEVEAIVIREAANLPAHVAHKITELFFNGVPTFTQELFYETYWRKIPLYRINHVWLFQEGFQIARNPSFERAKRAADIVFSSFGLLIFAPFLLPSMLAVWLNDRGPVFFTQPRVGRNRIPFNILKLRTMRMGSDAVGMNLYTQTNDSRITPIGNFLRKSRLDEVPQLWNVFRGQMSLIGPRPEWTRLVENYEKVIPSYHFRHLVRPGITGWAQVNYPYGASVEDTLRKQEYDLYYIRHFSFVMDASIILRTVNMMLFGKGR
jgi:exopolysaccharide biosynthesis polyprenyl glycosylphosphotransferase